MSDGRKLPNAMLASTSNRKVVTKSANALAATTPPIYSFRDLGITALP